MPFGILLIIYQTTPRKTTSSTSKQSDISNVTIALFGILLIIYQVVFVHGFLSENDGQELVVGDVLQLSADDASCFWENKILIIVQNDPTYSGKKFKLLGFNEGSFYRRKGSPFAE